MGTPIYGVLILDPPRHSPLELVKSSDADLAREAGILLRSTGGTSAVTPGRIRPADLQCIQPRRTRTEPALSEVEGIVRATHACTRTEMSAPQMKE